ncbi:MAG: YrbL family protein [Pseudomonadota bacterium]
MIDLGKADNAFAQGGNRLCFFHPQHDDRCIKVARPERTPALRRKSKTFPSNLKPLSRFDENTNEIKAMHKIDRYIGDDAYGLIPYCYGMLATNFGPGLCSELITNSDNRISLTLKQYIWDFGKTQSLMSALDRFVKEWSRLAMPSKKLLLHNIVVQQNIGPGNNEVKRLVVVDGLGWSGLAFLYYKMYSMGAARALKKASEIYLEIDNLLVQKQNNSRGYHGWLKKDKREEPL